LKEVWAAREELNEKGRIWERNISSMVSEGARVGSGSPETGGIFLLVLNRH